ncbi:MAG: hypothetical protein MZU91_04400 [Desulfosudis oleivorans]|nr:hypothetical protein [Desulfosudis oleivorans]
MTRVIGTSATGKRGDHICPRAGRIHDNIAADFPDFTCCLIYGFDAYAAAVRFDYFRNFMPRENNSAAQSQKFEC